MASTVGSGSPHLVRDWELDKVRDLSLSLSLWVHSMIMMFWRLVVKSVGTILNDGTSITSFNFRGLLYTVDSLFFNYNNHQNNTPFIGYQLLSNSSPLYNLCSFFSLKSNWLWYRFIYTMKLKVVSKKIYDYVRHDLKEIAFPSSLPDPPHIKKRPKLTWRDRYLVWPLSLFFFFFFAKLFIKF